MIETRNKLKGRATNLAKSTCLKYLNLPFKMTKTLSISPVTGLGRLALTACLAAFVGTPALLESGAAKAQPYGNPIPPGPFVSPAPGFDLPSPVNVPGKEVSFGNLTALEGDRDQLFATAPGQAVFFDGVRRLPQSGLRNAWNFDGLQVDAMANIGDVLFQAVRNNLTWLLFSVQNDRWGNAIFAEAPGGTICLWSINGCKTTNNTPEVVGEYFAGFGALLKNGNPSDVLDASNTYPVTSDGHLIDVDGLEVWGPEPALGYNPGTNDPASDANVFSAEGDSSFSVKCRSAGVCHTYTQSEIAAAIGRSDLATSIDVDGLMTNLSGTLDPGGLSYLKMLFSVRPIGGLDGAEIWDWSGVPGDLAVPLSHGGHAWDTAFDLRGKLISEGFGDMALSTTPLGQDVNLDAIEAASTESPGPLPLLGVGAAFGFSRNLRKRIKTSKSSEVISALG
jgi:hypothetical protein